MHLPFPTAPQLLQSDSEIYAHYLLPKKHGFPLWCPRPLSCLPFHHKQGVSIGDVGILTSSGEFEFFFNICAGSLDAVNQLGVPDGFEPISPLPQSTDIAVDTVDGSGRALFSHGIEEIITFDASLRRYATNHFSAIVY